MEPSATQALEPFYDKLDPAFLNVRKVVREVLQKEEDLNEIVQLVGKVGFSMVYAVAPAQADWQPAVDALDCIADCQSVPFVLIC